MALDDQTALALFRKELDPDLREAFEMLLRTGGKLVPAALLMNMHRNTLRRLELQLRQILKRHRF